MVVVGVREVHMLFTRVMCPIKQRFCESGIDA
jgi:hypothetical protein